MNGNNGISIHLSPHRCPLKVLLKCICFGSTETCYLDINNTNKTLPGVVREVGLKLSSSKMTKYIIKVAHILYAQRKGSLTSG